MSIVGSGIVTSWLEAQGTVRPQERLGPDLFPERKLGG